MSLKLSAVVLVAAAVFVVGVARTAPPQPLPMSEGVAGDAAGELSEPVQPVREEEHDQDSVLRERLALANERISSLEKTVESYGTVTNAGLALVALLLAVVGIAFPIYTQITSINPAKEAAKDARTALAELDRRFTELLDAHATQQIERAIERLGSGDDVEQQTAAVYLSLNSHYTFTEKQLFDLCRVSERSAMPLRLQLLMLLAGRKTSYVDRVFVDLLTDENAAHYITLVLRHCTLTGKARLWGSAKEWLISSDDRRLQFSTFTACLLSSRNLLEDLINDGAVVSKIPNYVRGVALAHLKMLASSHGLSDLVESSLLAKSVTDEA